MRVYKCDSCEEVIDDLVPVTATLLEEMTTDFDDDDDVDDYEMVEYQFCSLPCLASWAMQEALNTNEVTP